MHSNGIAACRSAVSTLFNLHFDEVEVTHALNSLLKTSKLGRRGTEFVLSSTERRRLEGVASESVAVADLALTKWLASVAKRFPGLSQDDEDNLRADLEVYLRVVIQRHGAEAALLLYPDDLGAQHLYDDLEDLGFDFP